MIDKSPDELIELFNRPVGNGRSKSENQREAIFYVLLAIYKTLNQKTYISYNISTPTIEPSFKVACGDP